MKEELLQKCTIRNDISILWKELQHEAKLDASDIKLTDKDEEEKKLIIKKENKN
jgi:hypothetical protein